MSIHGVSLSYAVGGMFIVSFIAESLMLFGASVASLLYLLHVDKKGSQK